MLHPAVHRFAGIVAAIDNVDPAVKTAICRRHGPHPRTE